MLPRLWGKGRFASVDEATLDHIRSLGATHVWYTGIPRHARGLPFVKGDPGSPYAVSDWYDVNPYLADNEQQRMQEWLSLVERTHRAGLKLIVDFVPNHVARDYGQHRVREDVEYLGDGDDLSTAVSDGNDFIYNPGQELRLPGGAAAWKEFPARASGNSDSPSPDDNDWYDTIRINYGDHHTRTWDKMLDILRFWSGMGVDGFRLDMVDLVPMPFLKWLIASIRAEWPQMLFVAETYRPDLYRDYIQSAGFDLLYDKEGSYRALRSIYAFNTADTPAHAEDWQSSRQLTWNWQFLSDLQGRMLGFLENHDEQRTASSFFAGNGARGIAALAFQALFNNASLLIYFGQEIGEDASESTDGRTSIFNFVHPAGLDRLHGFLHGKNNLDEAQASLLRRYRSILGLSLSPVCDGGLVYDLCWCNGRAPGFDPDRHFAWLRSDGGRTILLVCNFSASKADMQIAIPQHAATMMQVPEQVRHIEIAPFDITIIDLNR